LIYVKIREKKLLHLSAGRRRAFKKRVRQNI
jgi:hypothetical protein